ncbi:UDP-2,3-diacylglucosamine diphosphatase [bacterium]|nr:UDP-2,3-diacylglucosamine diphosphatase [bacterium]
MYHCNGCTRNPVTVLASKTGESYFYLMLPENHIKTSSHRQVLLVADAHLPLDNRPGASDNLSSFYNLMKTEGAVSQCIMLLGDIFDFWYEWEHVIPKRAFRLLSLLEHFSSEGKEVHYFAGNHDFKLAGFLQNTIGLSLHMDSWSSTIDGRKVYFHHGDGMAESDTGYRKLKAVMRSRLAQIAFGRVVHPDLAMSIGKLASQTGRSRYEHLPEQKPMDEEYLQRAEHILTKGYDLVIFGHTHRMKSIQLKSGWFHNPGPFLNEKRYSVIRGDLPEGRVWI